MMVCNLGEDRACGQAVDGEATVVVVRSTEPAEVPWAEHRLRQARHPRRPWSAVLAAPHGGRQQRGEHLLRHASPSTVAISGTIAIQPAADRRPAWHRLLEGRALFFTSLDGARGAHRRHRRARPDAARRPRQADARGGQAVPRSRARGARHLRARGLLHVPLADDPSVRAREPQRYGEPSTMAESKSTTTRSSGAPSAPVRIWRAKAAKYPSLWHYRHLIDPRGSRPGRTCRPYARLADGHVDLTRTDRQDPRA